MLYLLDANVLITAHNTYYSIEQVPEFWDWLRHQGESGHLKMPLEIIEEVKAGKDDDPLLDWIKDEVNFNALKLDEAVDSAILQRVVRSRLGANKPHVAKLSAELSENIGKLEATYDPMARRETTVSSAA